MALPKFTVLGFLLLALSGTACTRKTSDDAHQAPSIAPALTEGGASLAAPSGVPSAPTPAQTEWKAVWDSENPLAALRAFESKHGLFLETARPLGPEATLLEEGPCGNIYSSLVRDTREIDEDVQEISEDGKVLRSWKTGSGEILRIRENRIYRELRYPESKGRAYVLAIGDDSRFEIAGESKAPTNLKTKFREVKCPKVDFGSDYAYCVEDPATKRRFVFQRPCT